MTRKLSNSAKNLVIVSGLPASGKSTIGRSLAKQLNYDFYDKDNFLDSLLLEHTDYTAELRQKLSRQADELFLNSVKAGGDQVAVSFWRALGSSTQSGTPTEWTQAQPHRVVELWCRCPPEVAAERFSQRKRHPGHMDGSRSISELTITFQKMTFFPLGLGELVELDTTKSIEIESVVMKIREKLAES